MAETLLAVLILLMVSSIVAAGIPSARRAYEKVVLASNAEVLLSTTITTLRNELGNAMDVKVNGNDITYYNTARGATSKISLDKVLATSPDTEKTIVLYRYFGDYVYNSAAEKIAMSSSSSKDKDLYVTYTSVVCQNGIITFSGVSAVIGIYETENWSTTWLSLSVRWLMCGFPATMPHQFSKADAR